ncbi:L-carnitine dehydratase/bile acid-inducible protein F [Methylobacterium sp. 4-46]|uniref:CaiB/BaiF CoA transferase family protein n=1 Tax=unclassified Methylobacterium TaxID=2615210 RepID=UPI000152E8B5|nr:MULTISPECIES: CaiB/BaiF CoA-transferase family protein [Methylobacterium]ACA18301.1 L-carnitine dehydratase/bile acid-inducible protein F [Methylobacterium sp. 4-46]WFT77600.1 CaiB/BaiF CoA-transferase family protein [Methylobacterium nodulans]
MTPPAPPAATGPLAGLRLVEFAGIGPGPFAAMLLADLGADILRVDRPGGADPYSRHVLTRSRRTVTADLKAPGDRARVLACLDEADALIEGFRPGVMERLGLGPEVVLARNPRLVYGRMTGWGQEGPLAARAGHDLTYIAVTGALAAIGPESHPVPPLNLVGDFGGGALYLAMGILAGILSARRTGHGQVVDCAICDGAASLMAMASDFAAQGLGTQAREANLLDGGTAYYRTYACADGRFVALAALEPHFFAEFRRRVGLEDDPAFDDRDGAALHRRLEALFLTRTRDAWCRLLEDTDSCLAPVLTLSEAPSHPHLAARGTYLEVDGVMQPAPAPRFSRSPAAIRRDLPATSLEAVAAAWRGAAP